MHANQKKGNSRLLGAKPKTIPSAFLLLLMSAQVSTRYAALAQIGLGFVLFCFFVLLKSKYSSSVFIHCVSIASNRNYSQRYSNTQYQDFSCASDLVSKYSLPIISLSIGFMNFPNLVIEFCQNICRKEKERIESDVDVTYCNNCFTQN